MGFDAECIYFDSISTDANTCCVCLRLDIPLCYHIIIIIM